MGVEYCIVVINIAASKFIGVTIQLGWEIGQVKLRPECSVEIWFVVTTVVVESGDKFKVVSHEAQFALVKYTIVLRLEYHDEQ